MQILLTRNPFFLGVFILKPSQKPYRRRDMVGKQVPTRMLLSYILCFAFHGFGLDRIWLMSLNRYPGVACDIPSHSNTFSIDLNPDWSGFYATVQEIQKYFEDFYRRHDLSRYMRFNTLVLAAKWHQGKGECMLFT